jgi:hypothetical protein
MRFARLTGNGLFFVEQLFKLWVGLTEKRSWLGFFCCGSRAC